MSARRNLPEAPASQQKRQPNSSDSSAPASFTPHQQEALRLVRLGVTIAAAMAHLGLTRFAWDQWRKRLPHFRAAADAAIRSHCLDIADGLADAASYARVLLDQCQRDESQPMNLRIRCGLAVLRRKPEEWLPPELPAPDPDPDLPPGLDSVLREPVFQHPDYPLPQPDTPLARLEDCGHRATQDPNFAIPADPSSPADHDHLSTAQSSACTHTAYTGASLRTPSNTIQPVPEQSLAAPSRQNCAEISAPQTHTSPGPAPASSENGQGTMVNPSVLNTHLLSRFESPHHFETLFQTTNAAHQPQTPAEELAVLRITQTLWRLRRLDQMEAAFHDTTIAETRAAHPSASAAAVMATQRMDPPHQATTRFLARTSRDRRLAEYILALQQNHLLRLQARRIPKPHASRPLPPSGVLQCLRSAARPPATPHRFPSAQARDEAAQRSVDADRRGA